MAVPKRRTSKSKKNSRKSTWKRKLVKETYEIVGYMRLILNGNSRRAYYPPLDEENWKKTKGFG